MQKAGRDAGRALGVASLLINTACACTNYLVTKGASAEGSNMISYSADSHTLYGALYHYPGGKHDPGTMRRIIDWDGQFLLGEIPEAPVTYNVLGNSNEHGLVIAETTFGGLHELSSQPGALIDYGSLIYIALQRSRTAREAISVMTSLVEVYGYASQGESFSIADAEEVWIMEMIGKGPGEKGAVWVARRVPNGYACSHANQARITTFPRDSPDTLYSADVMTFAREKGLYSGSEEDFSFSDTYHPLTFEGARAAEARVWAFFQHVAPGAMEGDAYLDYITGNNLSHRMPLWVKPDTPLKMTDVMALMRIHYEDTPLDFRFDIGAQGFSLPYRWRPLTWKASSGAEHFNERSVGTQQTGWWFVAQIRARMPPPLRALLMFGVDDTANSVLTPFYGGQRATPQAYADGDMMSFSFDAAFWVFNLVANFVYTRYNLIHPAVAAKQNEIEEKHMRLVTELDERAVALWEKGRRDDAVDFVTQATVQNAEQLVKDWLTFFGQLFVRFMDGNVKTASTDPEHPLPKVNFAGYPSAFLDIVASQTGDRYLVPSHVQADGGPGKGQSKGAPRMKGV